MNNKDSIYTYAKYQQISRNITTNNEKLVFIVELLHWLAWYYQAGVPII